MNNIKKINFDEDISIIIFNKINKIFNYLPFGVLVDNSILYIHMELILLLIL